jgi:hypothetical protein
VLKQTGPALCLGRLKREDRNVTTLKDLVEALDLRPLTPLLDGDAEVTGGYASDLLSDVLAHAPEGGMLVTLQVHLNVIAVASHAGLRAVVFSCGRMPDDDILQRAAAEGLSLFGSKADTFELVGRLYELGLRGSPA